MPETKQEESRSLAASLLPELDAEMATTRRLLARVPRAAFGWRPHPRSFSMGELASHIATTPGWLVATLGADSFDTSPGGVPAQSPRAGSVEEAVALFDAGVARARVLLEGTTDAAFGATWTLLSNGAVVLAMPRAAVVRSFVLGHLVHHRGQLSVYLRLNDVPVPSIYGPSADEPGM